MAADDFFARWAKKNAETQTITGETADVAVPESRPPATSPDKDLLPPTLEDVAQLTPEADFSAFMARGVDETVKRAAMKKLFSDPHFNVMDGLDVYIDDYNSFEALTPDIVATLNHAKALLDPLSQSGAPMMNLLDALDEEHVASGLAEPDEQQAIEPQEPEPSATEDAMQTEHASDRNPSSKVD